MQRFVINFRILYDRFPTATNKISRRPKMAYVLPELGYAYDALEPHFDEMTMNIHHTKHHQAYVNNANAALESLPEFASLSAEELVSRLKELPADKQTVLRNNAGGCESMLLTE